MSLNRFLLDRSRITILTIGTVMTLIVWGIDFLTAYLTESQLSFSIFYMLPILVLTWYAGQRYGIAFSLISAVLWLSADVLSGQGYLHPFIPLWNMSVRLMFFLSVTFLLNQIRMEHQRREELIVNLQKAMEKIRTLRGMLPICAWCKKIRNDEGYWQQVELYVQDHSDATFTHGICPECAAKLEREERT